MKKSQQEIPKNLIDIKKMIPKDTPKDQRAKLLFQGIKNLKSIPQTIIEELEKREAELLPIGKDKSEVKGIENIDTEIIDKRKDKEKERELDEVVEVIERDGKETKKKREDDSLTKSSKRMKGEENRQSFEKSKLPINEDKDVGEESWTNEDICSFISSKGFSSDVVDIFKECKITGLNIPDLVEEESLKDFGITAKGTIKGLIRLFSNVINK